MPALSADFTCREIVIASVLRGESANSGNHIKKRRLGSTVGFSLLRIELIARGFIRSGLGKFGAWQSHPGFGGISSRPRVEPISGSEMKTGILTGVYDTGGSIGADRADHARRAVGADEMKMKPAVKLWRRAGKSRATCGGASLALRRWLRALTFRIQPANQRDLAKTAVGLVFFPCWPWRG